MQLPLGVQKSSPPQIVMSPPPISMLYDYFLRGQDDDRPVSPPKSRKKIRPPKLYSILHHIFDLKNTYCLYYSHPPLRQILFPFTKRIISAQDQSATLLPKLIRNHSQIHPRMNGKIWVPHYIFSKELHWLIHTFGDELKCKCITNFSIL